MTTHDEPVIIRGNELCKQLCEAIGVDFNHVTRIVIDTGYYDGVVNCYIEKYGTEKLLTVNWGDLSGANIAWSDEEK